MSSCFNFICLLFYYCYICVFLLCFGLFVCLPSCLPGQSVGYTKFQNCWDIAVFSRHANFISFLSLKLKKILCPIPYSLNQCCLAFLFILKPAIEWTTLSQGRGDFKKNSYSQIFAWRIPNVPTYFAT